MDTMYRKKAREAEEALEQAKREKKEPHAADGYNPKVRPRETHPDAISADKRIRKNLNKLNRELVVTPANAATFSEDRGAKVVTRVAAVRAQAPVAIIFTCLFIAAVFMYMLSLNVQIDEYSRALDARESAIADLKEEAVQLEILLEGKYNLDEIERIATGQYGMISATGLPKKYISISEETEAWIEEPVEEEGFFASLWNSILTFFGVDGE